VTGQQALILVQKQYAGAADAYSRTAEGAQQRLDVAIHRTEVTIGTALIPTISRLSTHLADWLDKSQNQERIQRDVDKAVKAGTQIVKGFAAAVNLVAPPIEAVVSALGGLQNAVEDALILGIVFKARKAAQAFGLIQAASTRTAQVIVADAAIERTALASIPFGAGDKGGGRGSIPLLGFGPIGVAAGVVTLLGGDSAQSGAKASQYPRIFALMQAVQYGHTPSPIEQAALSKLAGYSLATAPTNKLADAEKILKIEGLYTPGATGTFGSPAKFGQDTFKPPKGAATPRTIRPLGPNATLAEQLRLDPNNVGLLQKQAANDRLAIAYLQKRRSEGKISNKKYVEQVAGYETDLTSTTTQIASIEQQAASARESAAKAAESKRQRAHLASVTIREHQLRDAIKSTHDSKAADDALVGFLKQEYHDKQLSGVARAQFHTKLVTEVQRENKVAQSAQDALTKAANRAADIAERALKAQAAARAKAKKTALDLKEGALNLAKQAADLALTRAGTDQALIAKATSLEEKADENLIKFYKDRIAKTKGLAQQDWKSKLYAAQADLYGVRHKTGAAGSFTLSDLYKEAESEFKMYGSNYGPNGTPLSPQAERGNYSSLVLKQKGNVHITQVFIGQKSVSQAMNDARAGARYLN
jgi:hypothetical protein